MTPTGSDIKSFLITQVDLWNGGQRDEFLDVHRAIAPEGVSLENLAGSPAQEGWGALEELWRVQQPTTRLRFEKVITSPSGEAAVLERITRTTDAGTVDVYSVHTYAFANGRLAIKYYVAPPGGEPEGHRLGTFLRRQVEAWNGGERDTLLELYRGISGGEVHLEYPLGAGEMSAWPFLDTIWEQAQPTTRLVIDHLALGRDGEAAMYVRNERINPDEPTNVSIEVYRLAEDGLHIRYFSEAQASS
jgi:hypothetical protein